LAAQAQIGDPGYSSGRSISADTGGTQVVRAGLGLKYGRAALVPRLSGREPQLKQEEDEEEEPAIAWVSGCDWSAATYNSVPHQRP